MRFGRLRKSRWLVWALGALDYCRSAVVVHWAWLRCVLGGCENVCGRGPWNLRLQVCCRGALGIGFAFLESVQRMWLSWVGTLATEGLLSWRTGHGPNAF